LPDLDLPHAKLAGKWSADQLLRDQRLCLDDHRPRLIELALLLVDGFPCFELALCELARALQCGSGPTRLRLVTGEVAAFRLIIDLDERVAGFDCGSRLEENLCDAPANLGVDRHLM